MVCLTLHINCNLDTKNHKNENSTRFLACKLYAKRNIPIIFCKYLQKIIAQCNCKYCFKIRIIYIIMVYIALVKASINGNSIRNTFTDLV